MKTLTDFIYSDADLFSNIAAIDSAAKFVLDKDIDKLCALFDDQKKHFGLLTTTLKDVTAVSTALNSSELGHAFILASKLQGTAFRIRRQLRGQSAPVRSPSQVPRKMHRIRDEQNFHFSLLFI